MTSAEAAKILDLPVDATPEQIETRFNELRAKLEDKVVKAPTPGLKAKYRESLEEITAAFEALTLAADASTLPVLQRQRTEDGGQKTGSKPAGSAASGLRSQVSGLSAPKPKASSKEFLIVTLIALAVLGAGGWWVMKTWAENETKARLAIEAKAESDRQAQLAKEKVERDAHLSREKAEQDRLAQAAAEKAEKERAEKLFTSLRSRVAALNVAYEAAMRAEQVAERELAERKSQERDLKGTLTPQARRVAAEVVAQAALVDWLRTNLPEHPARIAKARADELLSARATDEAAAAVDAYADAIDQLKADISSRRQANAVTGSVTLTANLNEVSWTLTDAFGVEHTGRTPATPGNIAFGRARIVFTHPRQPAMEGTLVVSAAAVARMNAEFPVGAVTLASNLGNTTWKLTDALGVVRTGNAPAEVAEIAPGAATVVFSHPGWPDWTRSVMVTSGTKVSVAATFAPSVLTVRTSPADAALAIGGVTRQPDGTWTLMPGEYLLRATKPGLGPQLRTITAGVNEPQVLAIELKPELSPRIASLLEQTLARPGLAKADFVATAWNLSTIYYYSGDREKYRALMRTCLPRLGELFLDDKWTMVNIALRASVLGLTDASRPLLTDRIDYQEISKYSDEKPGTILNIGAQRSALNLVMGNVAKAKTIMATALADSRSADRWQHKVHELPFDSANDRTNEENFYNRVYDHLMTLGAEQFPEVAEQYLVMVPAEYRAKTVAYAAGAGVWAHVMVNFKRGNTAEALRRWEQAVENQHAANVRYKISEARVFNNTQNYLRTVLDFGHPEAVEPIQALATRLIAAGKMLPHATEEKQPLADPKQASRHAAELSVTQFTRFAELEKSPDPNQLGSLWLELRRYGLSR